MNSLPTASEPDRTARIRALNDAFRQSLQGGQVLMTAGFAGLPTPAVASALEQIRRYSGFTPDDDPHGEHDFGAFEVAGQRCFWKIDCYDETLSTGSEDPADPAKTVRVLTIMIEEEY